MGYRDYATAKGHIVDANGHGDFTTIAAAITAASSGQTIFIMPGTYTEDPTLKAGVNLAAYDCDALTPNVTILGKCSFTTAGTMSMSGIRLQTNGDYALSITGSAASIAFLTNCFVYAQNNVGMLNSSSSGSAKIDMKYCNTDTGGATTALYTLSGAGFIVIRFTLMDNNGSTTTASTNSSGNVIINNSVAGIPFSTSSTGALSFQSGAIGTENVNTACMTTAGSGLITFKNMQLSSGSASCVSIGTGTTLTMQSCTASSSNTNVLTGAGTLKYAYISFDGSSSGHDVSVETAYPTL